MCLGDAVVASEQLGVAAVCAPWQRFEMFFLALRTAEAAALHAPPLTHSCAGSCLTLAWGVLSCATAARARMWACVSHAQQLGQQQR
jgi:hypothetical protein